MHASNAAAHSVSSRKAYGAGEEVPRGRAVSTVVRRQHLPEFKEAESATALARPVRMPVVCARNEQRVGSGVPVVFRRARPHSALAAVSRTCRAPQR